MAFLGIIALAVSECAQIVGVLLVFTLMVGPPAAAQYVTTRLWSGLASSALLAVTEAWCGIAIAYYTDWPVSFCIAALSAVGYFSCLGVGASRARLARHGGPATSLPSSVQTSNSRQSNAN
jgi:zinc/manganese transport system permease protein